MVEIEKIVNAIDSFLDKKNQRVTTPVEINPILERMGLLNDSSARPGLPLRKILRKGKIPHAYQIGVNWQIPHSGASSRNLKPFLNSKSERNNLSTGHKLTPIGDLLIKLIAKKYRKKASCLYEHKPDWLLTYPSRHLLGKRPELKSLYEQLTNSKFSLEEILANLSETKQGQKQSFDIWIGDPYNFAVEFDEKQHFNQFRKITLDFYDKINLKFPVNLYRELNCGIEIKPGKSGFTKLKSFDPLFPEMLVGENQDNRIRQRAFRDFLKDIMPIENGFNPTLRIPFQIANKKIKDFTDFDVSSVEEYITKYNLI